MGNVLAFRRRWLVLLGTLAVLVVALTAGNLFAANEGQEQDGLTSSAANRVQEYGTDPQGFIQTVTGQMTESPEIDAGTDAGQVVPQESDPYKAWVTGRPEEMGPFTVETAAAASSESVSWMLYQAVHKQAMTSAEAETFRAWHGERPDSAAAPELMRYQPSYLDKSYDGERPHELFRQPESH